MSGRRRQARTAAGSRASWTRSASCFFQTDASLAYTEDDLPAWLPDLPLTYHVHLPLDLPWLDGAGAGWEKIVALVQKSSFLSPRAFVLHPPDGPAWPDCLRRLAERLPEAGLVPSNILLENTRENDLTAIWDEAGRLGFGVCLDLGHLLAYHQKGLLGMPGLWERTRMIHAYAPDLAPDGTAASGRHLSLGLLDEAGRDLLALAMSSASGEATLMIELFQPEPFLESLALAKSLARRSERGTPTEPRGNAT